MLDRLTGVYFEADNGAQSGGDVDPIVDDLVDADASPTDRKEENRAAYEARKARERLAQAEKELAEYKRREKAALEAKKTDEERRHEELENLRQENERLKRDQLAAQIAAEYKLPKEIIPRLLGNDEDSLRADAEELSRLVARPRAGSPTDPARDGGKTPTYTREQLRNDPKLAASIAADYRAGKVKII